MFTSVMVFIISNCVDPFLRLLEKSIPVFCNFFESQGKYLNHFPSPLGIPLKCLLPSAFGSLYFVFYTTFSFTGISACPFVESFGLVGIAEEAVHLGLKSASD